MIEFFIGLCVLAGFLFLMIGSIRGYLPDKGGKEALEKLTRLGRRVDRIQDQLTGIERKIENLKDVSVSDAPAAMEQSVESTPKPETTVPPEVEDLSETIESEPVGIQHVSVTLPPPLPKEVSIVESKALPPKPVDSDIDSGAAHVIVDKEVDDTCGEVAGFASVLEGPMSRWAAKFKGMTWETFIGTYLIRNVGIVLITIAVFIGLAQIAKNTGPASRVFSGYCVGLALLIAGRLMEKNYSAYARVLYSGGLAVAYFVTFATHYIEPARIFDSPLPSLAGMGVIVGIWAWIAQKRHSPTIALFVTGLGHFTIALTTFTVDEPAMVSVFGVLVLSVGSAFFLLKNRWYYIAAVGMLASYANHLALLSQTTGSDQVGEFVIGISVLSVYLILFACAELFSPEEVRREKIPNWFRSVFVGANTGCYFAIGSFLVESYTFTEEYHYIFRYCLAATMMGIAAMYYVRHRHDPLYNTYTAKAVALLTFGLAAQFSGSTLTIWFAIEMIALLASSRRSGLVITRMLAHSVAFLAVVHGTYSCLIVMRFMEYSADGYARTLSSSVLPIVGFGLYALLYERTDWSSRMRFGLGIPKSFQTLFWQLDFAEKPLQTAKKFKKPFGGLFFPYLASMAGAWLLLGYSLRLIDIDERFNLYGVVAVLLLVAGWALNTRSYTLVSLVYAGLATFTTFHTMFNTSFEASVVLGVVALAACALAVEDRYVPYRDSLVFYRYAAAPYLLYGAALWSIWLYLTHFFSGPEYMLALLSLSVACAALTKVLHPLALTLCGTIILFCSHLVWHVENFELWGSYDDAQNLPLLWRIAAAAIVALCLAGDRFTNRMNLKNYSPFFAFVAFTTTLHFIRLETSSSWFGFFVCAAAFGFVVYTAATRSLPFGLVSWLLALIASFAHTVWAYVHDGAFWAAPTILGFLSAISIWVVYERLNNSYTSKRFHQAQTGATAMCIGAATLLSLVLPERIPALSDMYLTISWAALAVVYFGVALATQQKRYRYAALSILALATFRVIVFDTSDLTAGYRVLAFGGLGVILLGLAFGYSRAFGQDGGPAPDDVPLENGDKE